MLAINGGRPSLAAFCRPPWPLADAESERTSGWSSMGLKMRARRPALPITRWSGLSARSVGARESWEHSPMVTQILLPSHASNRRSDSFAVSLIALRSTDKPEAKLRSFGTVHLPATCCQSKLQLPARCWHCMVHLPAACNLRATLCQEAVPSTRYRLRRHFHLKVRKKRYVVNISGRLH